MRIMNSAENAIYDDNDSRCGLWLSHNGREVCGFIQVLDIGNEGNRHAEPFQKRYWGPYNADDPEGSIQWIMDHGGKWPNLPHVGH